MTLTATADGQFSVHLIDSFRLLPEPSGAALLLASLAVLGTRPKRAGAEH